jgi:hypothetical protein
MRGRAALTIVLGSGLLCNGATALAQSGGGSEVPRIRMTSGCLDTGRVTVRIVPREGTMLSPVHIRVPGYEAVHLTGVTQEAAVIVRVPKGGRVSVTGETIGGSSFSTARTYRRCPPRPLTPAPVVTGGGEG